MLEILNTHASFVILETTRVAIFVHEESAIYAIFIFNFYGVVGIIQQSIDIT